MLLGKQAHILRKISEKNVVAELVEWHTRVSGQPIVDNFLFCFHTEEFVGAKIAHFYCKRSRIALVIARRAFRGARHPAAIAARCHRSEHTSSGEIRIWVYAFGNVYIRQ